VCATDPWCCGEDLAGNGVWDAVCVLRVGTQLCAPACNPSDTDGPCCAANGTPGCEINTVEMCVCAVDPACCEAAIGWDDFCVTQVDTLDCGVCKY
jgi:hypothetical protein